MDATLYGYPVIVDGEAPTHVVVPVADFLRLRDAAASCSSDEETQFPLAVSHAVLSGVNPIRAWREHLGLPQEELGQRMGTSKSGVCRLEQAERPKRSTLERVATALGLDDPDHLIKLY